MGASHASRLAAAIDAAPNQASLARAIGVSEATISRWKGGIKPKAEYWPAVAAVLGVDFTEPDEPAPDSLSEVLRLLVQLGGDVQSLRAEVAELRSEVRQPPRPSPARRQAPRPV